MPPGNTPGYGEQIEAMCYGYDYVQENDEKPLDEARTMKLCGKMGEPEKRLRDEESQQCEKERLAKHRKT